MADGAERTPHHVNVSCVWSFWAHAAPLALAPPAGPGGLPAEASACGDDVSYNVDDTCYCCGQTGRRKSDCPCRNEKCNRCGKIGHLNLTCQSGSDVEVNVHAFAMDNLNGTQCRDSLADWKRLGEPSLNPSHVRLHSATGDDMGVTGSISLRGWCGDQPVLLTALVAAHAT